MTTTSRTVKTSQRRSRRTAPPTVFSRTIFRLRPRVEWMEDRTLLATFLVTSAADSGPGSLRQAILDSDASVGATNTIDFNIASPGVQTIFPLSPLPGITDPVLIDGESQPGYAGTPLIQIDGSQSGGGHGLTITGPDVTVRGLDITTFSQGAGIHITGTAATGDRISADFLGTDPTGSQPEPDDFGVEIDGGAHDNLVGGATAADGNLIAFNTGPGVTVEGDGSVGNQITADRIFDDDASPTPTPAGLLQFDGSSFVRLPENLGGYVGTNYQNSEPRTFEAWFQTTSGGVILGNQNSDPPSIPTYGSAQLYVGSDGKLHEGGFTYASPIVNDGRWHFVAWSGQTLYVDGQIVGSLKGFPGGGYFDQIGTGYTKPSDPSTPGGWYFFRGQIADVRIWNTARSADEIRQDMTSAQAGTDPDLDAYYPFDEGQGPTAHDLSSNHYDATLAGLDGHLPTWSSSDGVAIDLGDDGVTANSPAPRQGPNDLQNHPIIVATDGGQLEGWLGGSEPDSTYRIDVFASAGSGAGGAGEAQDDLGSLEVITDAQGQAVFDVPFTPPAGLPVVTATATDPGGNTSEVSDVRAASLESPAQPVRVVPGQPLILSSTPGEGIAIQDPAAGPLDPAWDLTLSVTAGLLTLTRTAGLVGSGNGTGTLHYEGSLSALDAALQGLSFTPPPGSLGNASVSLDAESTGAAPLRTQFLITDGRFLVTTTADGGAGSLRQVLLDSNAATGGTNTIDFDIAGPGEQTIAPASPLPAITSPVLIDGTSEPGYASTPLIAIVPASPGMADGLTITGSAATVRGLANGGFALGAGDLPDDLTLQSGPLEASDGGNAGLVETYRIDTSSDGRLLMQVDSGGIMARLSLLDAQGQVLVESYGLSPANRDGLIDQHLAAGTYFLRMESSGSAGELALTATFNPTSPPFQPINVGSPNYSNYGLDPLAVGDFNGDGIPDLVAMDGVHPGLGDGTFQKPSVGLGLSAANPDLDGMVTGDFNGDGKLDVAVAFIDSSDIAVLLGNGDGTFQAPQFYAVGSGSGYIADPPEQGPGSILVAGDFTGDGHLDLAVANSGSNDISVLLGNGDGTFQPAVEYAVGQVPAALVAGDFTGDGHLDLAVADSGSNEISVLLGNGDGTFQPAVQYAVGSFPDAIVAGDFTGDGRLDLAVACGTPLGGTGEVSVLLGNGDGTFQAPRTALNGVLADDLVAGDFRGDGKLDLAVANYVTASISVLLGNGDGTFQAPQIYSPGDQPLSLVAGDFTGDGHLDLATADYWTDKISVLLNNGDGTFQLKENLVAGSRPYGVVAGDFIGNGRLDLAIPNTASRDISVLMGNGDGTFQPQERFAPGFTAIAIVSGDFNADGRLDLAVTGIDRSTGAGEVAVLLGNGDGTFQPQATYALGFRPWFDIVAGDFTGDGRLDLAVTGFDRSTGAGEVAVLLANGDGTFQPAVQYAVGSYPVAIAAGDFAGDGHLDLAVANSGSNDISLLLGNGDGTFQPAKSYAVGLHPNDLLAGDFTGSGRTDLAVAGYDPETGAGEVSVMLGNGDGTFRPPVTYTMGSSANFLVAGDFTGNGRLDLALSVTNPNTGYGEVSVMLGNGDGTFQTAQTVAGNGHLTAGDFNGDGRTDLAVADNITNTVSVLLSNGDGTFAAPGQFVTALRATPVVADVKGDGINDVLVVDGAGDILYRQGIPGRPGTFEPPVTVNPGYPSRDIAWVPNTRDGPLLASVDARDNAVSLYSWRQGGFVRIGSLATGRLPAQIIAADLNANGRDDLVVRNAGDGTLTVFFNNGLGSFLTGFLPFSPVTLSVGLGASDVQAIDTTGDGSLDLVVANKLAGQVSILRNLGDRSFAPPAPYRAATGLSEIDPAGSPEVTTLEATAGVAAGTFTPGGPTSLVTINPGSRTLDVLAGLGGGRFANPTTIETQSTSSIIRAADFTGNGIDDVAILSADGLRIYLGDGKGGFLPPTTYAVPAEADGLTVAGLLGNGKLDLLVGDAYGDVLVLIGNGDGTFQPYREANQTIELAVADLTGSSQKDIIYADQGLDRVVVDYGAGNSLILADQSTGLLQPGAVALADLNGDGIPDLIVANSGSNNVLIYPGLGNGQFGPAINGGNGYFVGDNPVGITVAGLTGDLPDLVVADEGSNQVSILINGSRKGGAISFSPGARLNAGGIGPVSTVVGHFAGGTFPDLLVTNSQSNDVTLLPGVGAGFFNDQNPRVYSVGTNPVTSFVGSFNGQTDLVTVNSGSNDLTLISGFEGASPVMSTIASGGVDPTTAFEFGAGGGFEDLVVGNTGDGALALFEGGPEGLSLFSTAEEPNLPDPTALAFSTLTGGAVQFYAATAGRESAELVALSLSIQLETTASPAGPGSTLIETVTGTGLLLAGPTSTATVQLVALNETSLPLVATVLTLTISGPGAELGPALAETQAAGVVATVAGLGTSAGQGPVSTSRGGGATSGPIEESDESGAAATAAPAGLAPWERFVLGVDEALEELSRENPGGIMGPPAPTGPSAPAPGPLAPAQGVGPGLRSVPAWPSDAEPDDPDLSRAPAPRSALGDRWQARDDVGRASGADGIPSHPHEDVGMPPGGSGYQPPDGSAAPRSIPKEAIDAAIERMGVEWAGSGSTETDPPTLRSEADEAGLAPVSLAVSLLAVRWGTLQVSLRRPSAADRPLGPPVRRRRPRPSTREAAMRCHLSQPVD
jgi:hypothetical protein